MNFVEVRLPENITYGSSGGPGYNTGIVVSSSGFEQRNINWIDTRNEYNLAYGITTQKKLEDLISFFHTMQGRANAFRLKDPLDFKSSSINVLVSPTDQLIGTGDGSATQFQIIKIYTNGVTTYNRTIKKPVIGTVKVSLDDVEQMSGWNVDTTTGIITFNTAPGNSVLVKAGYEFDVPVRFDTDILDTSLDNYQMGRADVPIVEVRM